LAWVSIFGIGVSVCFFVAACYCLFNVGLEVNPKFENEGEVEERL